MCEVVNPRVHPCMNLESPLSEKIKVDDKFTVGFSVDPVTLLPVNQRENKAVFPAVAEKTTCWKFHDADKSVRFSSVAVRQYYPCAMPSPSVSSGVPIGLDWKWICESETNVDEHIKQCELRFQERLERGESVRLSPKQRRKILTDAEVSKEEIEAAKASTLQGKHDRLMTLMRVSPIRFCEEAPLQAARHVFRVCKRAMVQGEETSAPSKTSTESNAKVHPHESCSEDLFSDPPAARVLKAQGSYSPTCVSSLPQ
uniref:Uncharacterized protein n=1 Tax=Octactis speculum TaxID=3111310 RepID=A0A7S2DKT9_9STRA|mmetsp:Transcript_50701/g.68991  ORF Transcript_50701/g.68991 Transcript_50701/m.68991 type:complete len:256 (+) Transcript_50701:46-813(+)